MYFSLYIFSTFYRLIREHTMKFYRGLEVYLHSFLTSALGGDDCLDVLVKRKPSCFCIEFLAS